MTTGTANPTNPQIMIFVRSDLKRFEISSWGLGSPADGGGGRGVGGIDTATDKIDAGVE